MTIYNSGHHPYLGLDWFILDLPAFSTVFIIFEKLFPLYPGQPVFRGEWQVDMKHFLFNHLSVDVVLLCINFFVHRLFSWAAYEPPQQATPSLLYLVELFVAVLGVLFALGFSKPMLDGYIIIVGFQAVLIHSNVKLPWG